MSNGSSDHSSPVMALSARRPLWRWDRLAARFLGADDFSATLSKGAAGAFGVQVCGAGLGLSAHLVVARLLGAQQYGIYALTLTWISVLSVPALLGQDSSVVRFLSSYTRQGAWSHVRGLRRCSSAMVLAASAFISLAGIVVIYSVFRSRLPDMLEHSLIAGFILLPVLTQLELSGAFHRGLKRAVSSGAFNSILRPVILLLITVSLWFGLDHKVDTPLVVYAGAVAAAISLIFSSWFLALSWPKAAKATRPLYEFGTWSSVGARLLLFAGIGIVLAHVDVLVLGAFDKVKEVGPYYAAVRLASLASYGLTATNIILAPMIAEHYSAGDRERLAKLVYQAAWLAFVVTVAAAAVLIMSGYWILDLFGSAFTSAYIPLLIMLVGQCVNAATGPAGYLMTMTEFERQAPLIFGGGATVNVLLSILLIPPFGMLGAAIASATAIIAWKLAALIFVRRHVGVNPTIFKRISV